MVQRSRQPTSSSISVVGGVVRAGIGAVVLVLVIVSMVIVLDHRRDSQIRARLTHAGGKYHAAYAGPVSLQAMIAPRTTLLDRVRFVDLHGQTISNEICRDLVALRSLNTLRLNHATIDGDSLKFLASHPNLEYLELVRTGLDDAAMALLANYEQLNSLDLRNNDITDAGAEHLLRLKKLCVLSLGGTLVTDVTVRRLKEVPTLRYINLSSTDTTPQARAELRAALPKCRTWPDP